MDQKIADPSILVLGQRQADISVHSFGRTADEAARDSGDTHRNSEIHASGSIELPRILSCPETNAPDSETTYAAPRSLGPKV
jgi:hypothetical protein